MSATICWRSIARRTVVSRSRSRAAFSNSSAVAASRISASRRLTIGSVSPSRKSHSSSTSWRYGISSISPTHGPGALLDVEQQARPAEALVLVELRRAARADRERAQQLVERVADGVGVGVRAEVAGALALAAAHHQRPRPLLVDGHGEERVALVVAQADVEARVVLLDQRVLEHQRLDLVAHRRPLDRLGRRDHLRRARVHVAGVAEVVRQALAQARRLADVDHPALGVLELVRARRVRDRAGRGTLHHQLSRIRLGAMAGRFSFSVPGRRNAGDPWFRIGTLDVGTTMLVVLLCVASMFVWAIEPASVWDNLVLDPDDVRGGEVWRLVTWPLANEPTSGPSSRSPSSGTSAARSRGCSGAIRFARPAAAADRDPRHRRRRARHRRRPASAPVELAVFLDLHRRVPVRPVLLRHPGVGDRRRHRRHPGAAVPRARATRSGIVLLFVTIATAALTARSMGLAQSLPWIPKIPYPGLGRRRQAPPALAPPRGGGDVVAGPWSASSRSGPTRGAPLPQPPPPTPSDARPGRARHAARQDLRQRHGRPHRRREAPPQRAQQAPPQPQ